MDPEVVARFDRIEQDLAQAARTLVAVADSQASLQEYCLAVAKVQDNLGNTLRELGQSIDHYVTAADARTKQMEASLDAPIRIITAEHTNGKGGPQNR
jgi:hypothetical protein